MWKIPCDFGTDEAEFKHYVGREPKDGQEMAEWVRFIKKGVDAQLDWEMICKCSADEFKRDAE